MNVKNRTLFIADNLDIMQGMDSETVDLIYLDPPDPPFDTNRNYKAPIGSAAEGAEFMNIWTDEDFRSGWYTQIAEKYPHIHRFIQTTEYIYDNSMRVYLKKMGMRLIEMRRILKPTGSIYLHCDPTASHYLKILMDGIFAKNNYQSEVIWGYRTQDVSKPAWPKKHDVLFHFGKKGEPTCHPPTERTRYPTQQPLALLNSVIKASSNEGDVVLDPFCGCATACVAAEKLNRQWIGIDISPIAEDITKLRLSEASEQGNLFSQITMSDVLVSSTPPQRTDTEPQEARQQKLPNYTVHKKNLYGEQEGFCNGCKVHFRIRNLTVDHIVPRSKNGTDHPKNLQLLCQACNSTKGTGTQAELIQKLKDRNII